VDGFIEKQNRILSAINVRDLFAGNAITHNREY
jgi:hypothetical protein